MNKIAKKKIRYEALESVVGCLESIISNFECERDRYDEHAKEDGEYDEDGYWTRCRDELIDKIEIYQSVLAELEKL